MFHQDCCQFNSAFIFCLLFLLLSLPQNLLLPIMQKMVSIFLLFSKCCCPAFVVCCTNLPFQTKYFSPTRSMKHQHLCQSCCCLLQSTENETKKVPVPISVSDPVKLRDNYHLLWLVHYHFCEIYAAMPDSQSCTFRGTRWWCPCNQRRIVSSFSADDTPGCLAISTSALGLVSQIFGFLLLSLNQSCFASLLWLESWQACLSSLLCWPRQNGIHTVLFSKFQSILKLQHSQSILEVKHHKCNTSNDKISCKAGESRSKRGSAEVETTIGQKHKREQQKGTHHNNMLKATLTSKENSKK